MRSCREVEARRLGSTSRWMEDEGLGSHFPQVYVARSSSALLLPSNGQTRSDRDVPPADLQEAHFSAHFQNPINPI